MEKYIKKLRIVKNIFEFYNAPQFKQSMFWSFSLGLLAHAFCYLNVMFCHDSTMVFHNENRWKISLGRFITPFFDKIRTPYNIVWVIGVLSHVFIALSVYYLICIFDIQNKVIIALIAGIFSTNFTLTISNATYINWSDIYMLSVLLYVLGAYFVLIKKNITLSVLAITIAMGIYQAYLPLTLLIIICFVILECFNNLVFSNIVKIVLRSFAVVGLSFISYSLLCNIFVKAYGASLNNGYNGIASVGDFENVNLWELIKESIYYLFSFFFKESGYITTGVKFANIVILLLCIVFVVLIFLKKKIVTINALFGLICLLVCPLAMNSVYIISKGTIHHLMIFHFCMYYVILLIFLNYVMREEIICTNFRNSLVSLSCYLLIGFVIFRSVTYANIVYLNQELKYQNTMQLMNRIVDRIEQTEGYVIGETPVEFYGELAESPLAKNRYGFTQLKELALMECYFGVTYATTFYQYFNEIFNYPINLTVYDGYSDKQCPYDMPVFPYEGSVQMFDDKVVVKLSE